MKLVEMIVPNEDFQTSVNIDFDFGSKSMVEGLIPTESVRRYLEEIISDVIAPSNQRAKLLVGAYGKGKSHVVLAALTAMWHKQPEAFARVISAYRESGSGFGDTLERFVEEGNRLLPVIISGSTADLRHSLLYALRNALNMASLSELMPQTNYDGAIRVLERWRNEYPDTLRGFEELTGMSASYAISQLENMDTATYELFLEAYPDLTAGSSFDVLDGSEVIDVYEHVLAGLGEHAISGIYVVYDEFSKYLETSINRSTFEDTKLLQDLAETCNRSGANQQLHLLLISHKSISNYIDSNLPKEKVDGWRGVSGRFRELEMMDDANQYYELLGNAIIKDAALWEEWLKRDNRANEMRLNQVSDRYVRQGLFDEETVHLVSYGCFPLHPLSTYLLARISEKVAQNERTLFTFACSREANSLIDVIGATDNLVTPDCIYDYFEPLLRKELYSSPLHRTYELTRASLRRVMPGSLESRIIKTIASIDVVAQYDKVAPTRQTIIELYTDCGYDATEVGESLSRIIESESVVYLRRSNDHLKLKETTGVRVDNEVSDRAEILRNTSSCVRILNSMMRGRAAYPARHNEERGIVRYFDCGFVDKGMLEKWQRGKRLLPGTGDGEVLAVYCDSADEHAMLKDLAKNSLSTQPLVIVVYPRTYVNIAGTLFRLEAARQLKDAAKNDPALAEEYEIIVEDLSEIVDSYIAGFFQPELRKSHYYVRGAQRRVITRKRKLSEELSILCDESFSRTPRITSEALNKNDLTGTAFGSRTKILKALSARNLEANLGFVGNGQEVSMVRSAFKDIGSIDALPEYSEVDVKSIRTPICDVLTTIDRFIRDAKDEPFSTLYDQLTGRDLRIGMRRGPIPIYLAYVLRCYRDEVVVTHNGEERPLGEMLLDDISKSPGEYRITRLNWSHEMEVYLGELSKLFGCKEGTSGRNEVSEAIRRWYVDLPQVTRTCRVDHTRDVAGSPLPKTHAAFFRAVRNVETDSSVFIFEQLPNVFHERLESPRLIDKIRQEKLWCDTCLARISEALASAVKDLFDENAHENTTLGSVLRDWVDTNPIIETHVFSGIASQVIGAIKWAGGDDLVTTNRLAKAATSLRIEDWNDARFADFIKIIEAVKNEVEGASTVDEDEEADDRAGILFVSKDGTERRKTFDLVECSGRSRLLKRSIETCIDEMGGSLTQEEKRQVVFEVLESLCQ